MIYSPFRFGNKSQKWVKKSLILGVNGLIKKDIAEAEQWLDERYGDSAPGKSTIIDWYAEFKHGRINTDDANRSGRPKPTVPENTRWAILTYNHKYLLKYLIYEKIVRTKVDQDRGRHLTVPSFLTSKPIFKVK